MPNNPAYRRSRLYSVPNDNKGTRNGQVISSFTVANKLISSPELGNPAGGPTSTRSGGISGGGISSGGNKTVLP